MARISVTAWGERRNEIVFAAGSVRYRGEDAVAETSALAQRLRSLGVGQRTRVAVLLARADDFAFAVFALAELGAGCVLLSAGFKPAELTRYVAESGATVLLTDDAGALRVKESAVVVHSQTNVEGSSRTLRALNVGGPSERSIDAHVADEFLLQFTSGSAGRPKIVRRSFANAGEEIATFVKATALGPSDRIAALTPLHHAYALLDGLLAGAAAGASVMVPERFTPADFLHLSRAERPTLVLGVPFMYELLNARGEDPGPGLEGVRYCFSAGAKASPAMMSKFRARYGVSINQLYGSTETGVIAFNSMKDGADAGTVGTPLPGRQVEVICDDGRRAREGETGLVRVRGPNVSSGYLNRPELNENVFAGGWFHTSDLGTLDRDGNLTLVGRRADFINVAGLKVDPEEVEEVLRALPGVKEAAVIGERGRNQNEDVVAFLVLERALDLRELRDSCRERLADYKVPRAMKVVSELPRNEMGKLLRKYLYAD